MRGDWSLQEGRTLTLQGEAYAARFGRLETATSYEPPFAQASARRAPLSGGHLLARWAGRVGAGAQFQLQAFYDRTRRDERPVAETRDTFDLDFQQRQPRWGRHDLTWGAGLRFSSGRIGAIEPTRFDPSSQTDRLFSAFVQDEVSLASRRLQLTAGLKVERNDYSGFELQPSGRLAWTLDPANTLVMSVARAVRTPSRVEIDYTTTSLVNPATPAFVRLLPNPGFQAEELVAYEAGYRARPAGWAYVTASAFFNQLDDVLSTELATPFVESSPGPPRLVFPVSFRNGLHGNSHGVELTADLRPAAWWRSAVNYSLLRVRMTRDAGSQDVSQERRYEGLSPRHLVHVRSGVDLPRGVSVDWLLRYASALPAGPVPDYTTSDVRVAWRPSARVELALVGQNLHRPHHVEWPAEGSSTVRIQRSGYVSLTWRR
jgi:iron complex outermembrane receptor protein